jgi:uncharacterized protein
MEKMRLGKSGLWVSRVGFGGIPITRLSYKDAEQCIRTAIELGVNFIDTATGYRDSEEKIGKSIKGYRDELIIATKSPPSNPEKMLECIDQSLLRLGVETIDLYQFHCINDKDTLKHSLDLMPVLEKAKEQGKIQHIGATVHGVDLINDVLNVDTFETVMIAINFIACEAAEVALPNAYKRDVGIIAMKPMGGGHIDNAYLAFKYFIGMDDVVPLVGIESPEEIREIVKIMDENVPATPEELSKMKAIRLESGTRFCRRCEYCMPCEHGVKIFPIIVLKSLCMRLPPEDLIAGDWVKPAMKSLEKCVQCGECEKKCPYNLEIREILQENLAYFNELQSQFGKA